MDAIIFAAGLGTRLGALGSSTPKALIDVGGKTMLEHVSLRLVSAGVDRIVINVHHHADQIERFTASHDLGAEVILSHEVERPLETGGGLAHAREYFRGDSPFFMHNVDVLTDARLAEMYAAHTRSDALATLAVSDRPTSRHLLFDEQGLYGRSDARKDTRLITRPPHGATRARAFAGVHVVNPGILDRITETGVFSILDVYLRLAAESALIAPWDLGNAQWLEIGNAERLEEARRKFADLAPPQ